MGYLGCANNAIGNLNTTRLAGAVSEACSANPRFLADLIGHMDPRVMSGLVSKALAGQGPDSFLIQLLGP